MNIHDYIQTSIQKISMITTIDVQIPNNSLSPEMVSDNSNLGCVSSNLSFCNVKDYDKYSSNPKLVLKNLTIKKNYRLVVGNVNINSISNKFANLNVIIQGKNDVLVIAETKTDLTH